MHMSKNLIIVGAGHAHLTTLMHCDEFIKRGHSVTVVSTSSYHYYSGMGPGMLSGMYRPQDIRFNVRKLVDSRGAMFVEDSVVAVDVKKRILILASGKEVGYNVVSFNVGSTVALGKLAVARDNVFPVKPIVNFLKARNFLISLVHDKTPDVLVIGGGPAGLEIAGNAWRLASSLGKDARITVVPGQRLLNGFPDNSYRHAKASLEERGIGVLNGISATAIEEGSVRLSTGRDLLFDACIVATGVSPKPLFRDSGLPSGVSGGLLVNHHLQSIAQPELFAGATA
jgi:NADH dehydrogenase FAD-containing subunit